ENAQKKVEARNFDIRKHLLEYDDVMNQQREVIYKQRREVLTSASLRPMVEDMIVEVCEDLVATYIDPDKHPDDWDVKGLEDNLAVRFGLRLDGEIEGADARELSEILVRQASAAYAAREQAFTEPVMRYLEKMILLQAMDTFWKDHLLGMDGLKEGIGLRGYGQRDPLQEYKREGYDMFMAMVDRVKEESASMLFRVQLARANNEEQARERVVEQNAPRQQRMSYSHGGEDAKAATVKRDGGKVGRNDLCPCGSGRKYKKCCGSGK
ncbi:MAG: SEC-C metal-binding domain-containing protein, partial [Pseudomonadota bacterium]